MVKILAILLLSIGWYGPGGGALSTKTTTRPAKTSTTATYRHYRGLNELKINTGRNKTTYRWRGPAEHGWLNNPYVK